MIYIVSFCAGVTVSFTMKQYNYSERDGNANVEVRLTGGIAVDVTVCVERGMF